MRLYWLAVPALLLMQGCNDPATRYRDAARELKITLERVDPTLQLALPLENSRLVLRLALGVENPTQTRFHASSLSGDISLDSDGAAHAIGSVRFAQGVDLKPGARTPVNAELVLGYAQVRDAWSALRMVGSGARPGTWHLEGKAGLSVLGVSFTVPFRAEKHVSGQ